MQTVALNDGKAGKLLDLVERRGPTAFDGLVNALKKTEQEYIGKILTDAVEQIEKSNKSETDEDGNNYSLPTIRTVPA